MLLLFISNVFYYILSKLKNQLYFILSERYFMAQKSRSDYTMLNIVSGLGGYAVNFVKLTKEQQDEVISRTFHEKI